MAEAPQHSSTLSDKLPSAVHSVPGLPATQGGADPYRPLSLLALAGFLLAALYAILVTVGGLAVFAQYHPTLLKLLLVLVPTGAIVLAMMIGIRGTSGIAVFTGKAVVWVVVVLGLGNLVAYSGSNPWMMPHSLLAWALVGAAALTCWGARARIAASENTLSGLALARWGLGLSLFFGVFYGLYLAGNIVAVRNQARDTVDEFLKLIAKDDLMQAFVRTLPQGSRPVGPDSRDEIELKYNTPAASGSREGPFSAFCRTDIVRLVELGGEQTRFEPGSIEQDFDKERYRMVLNYKISGPVGTYDAVISAIGMAVGGSGKRQWHVDPSGIRVIFKPPNDENVQDLFKTGLAAHSFVRDWAMRKVRMGDLDEAYMDTVPPEQREKQRNDCLLAFPATGALTGVSCVPLRTSASKAYLEGRQAFAEGSLLIDKEIWPRSGQRIRDEVANVRKLFAGTLSTYITELEVPLANIPRIEASGKQAVVGITCHILFRRPEGGPPVYSIECEAAVEVPIASMPMASQMRIRSLRLLRGRTVTPPKDLTPNKK
jgi:hypothetical protein